MDGKTEKIKVVVTFVCTGNTCRSPMAEYMFKAYLKEKKRLSDFSVNSAGLYARRGDVLSATAHDALEFLGVKHNQARRAKPFTVQMQEDSDIVVTMSERHKAMCDGDNVISFDEIVGAPIADPFGGSLQTYLDCAAQIRSAFDEILKICDGILKRKRGDIA